MTSLLGYGPLPSLLGGVSLGSSPLSVSGEICTYLQGQSMPTALNYSGGGTVNLFDTFLPDTPDIAVAVIPRPGISPLSVLAGTPSPAGVPQARLAFARPRIQVMVRCPATGYETGLALMNAIFGALQGLNELFLNGAGLAFFHYINAVQSPAYLGETGGRERHLWALNMDVWWEDPALA